MSVISRVLAPGIEVSVHSSPPGRGGVGMLSRSLRVEGTQFISSNRDAVNAGDIVMEAMLGGLATHLAVWIDHEVEGECQMLTPQPVVEGQQVIIPAGRLRLRFA